MIVAIETPPDLATPDQPADLQPPAGEPIVKEPLVFARGGERAVVLEVRRDVLLAVLARGGVHVLEQPLYRPDQRVTDPLHRSGVAQGAARDRPSAFDGSSTAPPAACECAATGFRPVRSQAFPWFGLGYARGRLRSA